MRFNLLKRQHVCSELWTFQLLQLTLFVLRHILLIQAWLKRRSDQWMRSILGIFFVHRIDLFSGVVLRTIGQLSTSEDCVMVFRRLNCSIEILVYQSLIYVAAKFVIRFALVVFIGALTVLGFDRLTFIDVDWIIRSLALVSHVSHIWHLWWVSASNVKR